MRGIFCARYSIISLEGVMGYPAKNLHPAASAASAIILLPLTRRSGSAFRLPPGLGLVFFCLAFVIAFFRNHYGEIGAAPDAGLATNASFGKLRHGMHFEFLRIYFLRAELDADSALLAPFFEHYNAVFPLGLPALRRRGLGRGLVLPVLGLLNVCFFIAGAHDVTSEFVYFIFPT
jgi:hypothetical protein